MKLIILTTTLSLIFFSCKKKHIAAEYIPVQVPCTLSKDLDTAKLYIQGYWNWLEEKRYSRGLQKTVYLTPQNQGYTLSMKLSNDTAYFFRNNKPDSIYTYKVLLQREITGTNYPEDNDPALVFYSVNTGIRQWYTPIMICQDFLILQGQYVTSIGGEQIWKKQ
jgi:hypothetical protein